MNGTAPSCSKNLSSSTLLEEWPLPRDVNRFGCRKESGFERFVFNQVENDGSKIDLEPLLEHG